jgi:hypothetical protein
MEHGHGTEKSIHATTGPDDDWATPLGYTVIA